MANSLTLGCDCLGEIHYFDDVWADERCKPTLHNAICMHEEDYGILWKHVDMVSGRTEVRRSRRLVVSSIATVGNYEYGFYWYFYQDGSIECEVKLTGIMSTMAVAGGDPGAARPHGGPRPGCAVPPAPLQRAARHGGRRTRQRGLRGGRGPRRGRPGSPENPWGPRPPRRRVSGPSTSMSIRTLKRCWWNGAASCGATIERNRGQLSRVQPPWSTGSPVSFTSSCIVPSR